MFLAIFAFQAALAAPGADKATLDAFKDVCWAVPDTQRIADSALKRGWAAVPRGRHVRADRLRDAIAGGAKDGYRVTVRQFERLVGGRQLLLTISRGELTYAAANGFGSTNCQVRELSDARPLSMAFVEEWLGRPADEVGEDEAGSFRSWYSIGRRDPTNLTIAYIPSGSSLAEPEMIPGIYLNAEAYGDRSDVPSPSPSAPPPERQLLDAFKGACSRIGNDLEPTKADAVRAGWTVMAEDGDPRVARLVKMGREATEKDGTSTGATFRRAMGGQDIFLIVSRYQDKSGFWGSGCRLYHFEATAPLEGKPLEVWMGKPPTGVQVPAPGLSKRLWEPAGWSDGITVEVSHVPQKHMLTQQYGLSGNILTAQAIGGF